MTPRIAVVGAGYFAAFQLEGWRDAGASVVGLCDLDRPRAEALAARFGVGQVHDDAATMLDALQPDLVDVVLPPAAQAAVVRAALERGLPTICQKPFGIDLGDAEAMAASADAQGVPLVVHENFRFTPWFRECRRLIDAGHFGRLHGISFRLRPGDGQGAARLPRPPALLPDHAAAAGARDRGALHRHLPLPVRRGRRGHRAAAPDQPGDRRRGCRSGDLRVRRRPAPGCSTATA